MIKTVFFDLDGTLINMDQDKFAEAYFKGICAYSIKNGYDGNLFLKAIMKGTSAMVMNDGKLSNEDLFWKIFKEITDVDKSEVEDMFYHFYEKEFIDIIKNTCEISPIARKATKLLKEKGYHLVLATNPLFPSIATFNRAKYAGLDLDDFDLITTYENSSYCKPNLAYYEEIIKKLALKNDEIMMIGNDVDEDYVIKQLGIDVYLLNNCLINKHHKEYDKKRELDNEALLKLFEQLPVLK